MYVTNKQDMGQLLKQLVFFESVLYYKSAASLGVHVYTRVRACVRACMRACVRASIHACVCIPGTTTPLPPPAKHQ